VAGVAHAHGPTIEISHSEMRPALLNLFAGTTVHFQNTVEMPGGHVVVDTEGRIESPALEHPGDDWHYTFEEEGVYEIFVRQHPDAKARIVVVPARATPDP
jgi:plastocyanin